MRADIDRLMAERDLVAIVVYIDEMYNPALDYLVGGAHLTSGLALKKHGSAPVIIANGMEVDEARKTGLQTHSQNKLGYAELVAQAGNDTGHIRAGMIERALKWLDVPPGKVGIYGVGEVNAVLDVVTRLHQSQADYTFVGESKHTLLDLAAATKDAEEIKRLQSVASRTDAVLQATWDFISGHHVQEDTLVTAEGQPLTIGAVKSFVRRALLDRDLEDTGMIFAQGRDAGFPHSRGEKDMALKLGQTIVFDLFPHEVGGGYYHDVTRTWCIGYAPENVQQIYQTVKEAYDVAVETFASGKPTHLMQEAVQGYFESKGHPTLRSHPGTEVGYVHGLGHGLGIKVHESPSISHTNHVDTFQPGQVITIEPGLYYPDEGYGVRFENSLYISENGELIPLTSFREDLVLPVKNGESS